MALYDLRINGIYSLELKIHQGRSNSVYVGRNIESNKEVIIKVEKMGKEQTISLLNNEAFYLSKLQGKYGIPTMLSSGTEGEYHILIMEKMMNNMSILFEKCSRKFSLKTVLMFANEALSILEAMHNENVIHRNLKPEHFYMGNIKKSHHLFLSGFSGAIGFWEGLEKKQIQLHGTPRYFSLNAHKGMYPSKKDDLESLGYIFIYFLKGYLP